MILLKNRSLSAKKGCRVISEVVHIQSTPPFGVSTGLRRWATSWHAGQSTSVSAPIPTVFTEYLREVEAFAIC